MRTKEDREKLLKILRNIPLISIASKQAGVDKSTIYRWMEKDKKFRQKVDKSLFVGRAALCEVAESHLAKKIGQGDFRAIKFFLENNDKRYIRPRPINIFADQSKVKPILSYLETKNIKDEDEDESLKL